MKTTDMTVGRPFGLLMAFALPLLIGNIFQQVYSIVDTMVAGYTLGDGAIAAIGATSALVSLIIDFAWGMNNGFALVVTRAFGSRDIPRLKKSVAGMMELNLIISLALTVTALIFLNPMLAALNIGGEIYADARVYISVIFIGITTTTAYNMFSSILRALGNSRIPLYFLIIATVLNIVLDIVLVAFAGMGVAGAAAATVISQALSALLCGIYILKNYSEYMPGKSDFRISRNTVRGLLSNGFAMAFMFCVIDIGSVIFQSATNSLGDMYITAHTAARRLIVILMSPAGSISNAASTFVGQNYGAGKGSRIKEGVSCAVKMEIVYGLGVCAIIYLIGGRLVAFTTGSSNPEMIKNAVLSLRIHLPLYPALGILFVLRNAMQAVDIKRPTVISSSLELASKIIAAFILIPRFGFIGTCIAEPIAWVVCMAFLSCVVFFRIKNGSFIKLEDSV